MRKYPYTYFNGKALTRVNAKPEVLCQMLTICHQFFGRDLLAKGIYTGHWYVQFQHPDGYFEEVESSLEHRETAHFVTRKWRQRFLNHQE